MILLFEIVLERAVALGGCGGPGPGTSLTATRPAPAGLRRSRRRHRPVAGTALLLLRGRLVRCVERVPLRAGQGDDRTVLGLCRQLEVRVRDGDPSAGGRVVRDERVEALLSLIHI